MKFALPLLLLLPCVVLHAAGLPKSVAEINAPLWVGRPPSDAVSGLVRLANGELRHYDYGFDPTPEIHHHPDFLATSYVVSKDQGLTWSTVATPPGHLGADMRSPISGEYMRLQTKTDGLYVIKTQGGIDGQWTMKRVWEVPIHGPEVNLTRSLVFTRKGRRVVSPWSTMKRFPPYQSYQVGSFYSDDDGKTWQHSNLIDAPAHQLNDRDKSLRWQNGATEPTIVELKDGRLWMIIRTSLDNHWQSFSTDGGATWGPAEPSPFYATLTDPTIGRLEDGRLLFLWNNTTPLPEFPKNEALIPFITRSAYDGSGEDFFNNRDALHGAISDDDGKTWRGFREVLLDSNRNDAHYGDTGGMDRSVHQPQFVQVEGGRVLVSTGQHWQHRSLFIFNPDWLLETSRASDFSNGLDDWSVHGYDRGIRGHCALNRYESSSLAPDPEDHSRKVLRVSTLPRRDAMFPRGGATWNFPMGRSGVVEMRLRAGRGFGGARICLLDRWLNPVDPGVAPLATYHLDLPAEGGPLKPSHWHTVRLAWKPGAPCEMTVDGTPAGTLPLERQPAPGLSYIHFQSTSTAPDTGLFIGSVKAEVTP